MTQLGQQVTRIETNYVCSLVKMWGGDGNISGGGGVYVCVHV